MNDDTSTDRYVGLYCI